MEKDKFHPETKLVPGQKVYISHSARLTCILGKNVSGLFKVAPVESEVEAGFYFLVAQEESRGYQVSKKK